MEQEVLMLTGIHILITYRCVLKCDHCFLHCGPDALGTMELGMVRSILDEAQDIGTVEDIYFEGGEPFLAYPSVLKGLRMARDRGFKTGIVTNAFGAVSDEDAEVMLRPLAELGLSMLSVSDDSFHYGDGPSPAKRALAAAERLGIPCGAICVDRPRVIDGKVHSGVMFRGRAADKLVDGLPLRPPAELVRCPHEDLASPGRVHIDTYGFVHLCQGLCIGNVTETPLSELMADYDVHRHPVAGSLAKGGPLLLAQKTGFEPAAGYVDECHFCYSVRRWLVEQYPDLLAPRQVYGLAADHS